MVLIRFVQCNSSLAPTFCGCRLGELGPKKQNHKKPFHLESLGKETEKRLCSYSTRDGTPGDPFNTFAFASRIVKDELKLPLVEHRSDDNVCDSVRNHY